MPPRIIKHSVAASLAAALLLASAQQARSQELPLAPAIEPSPGVDARDVSPLGSRDMTADPVRGDSLRGLRPGADASATGANTDDAAPGAANYGAPVRRRSCQSPILPIAFTPARRIRPKIPCRRSKLIRPRPRRAAPCAYIRNPTRQRRRRARPSP